MRLTRACAALAALVILVQLVGTADAAEPSGSVTPRAHPGSGAAPQAPRSPQPPQSAEAKATAKAKVAKRPVRVDSLTTATRSVAANPDGSFTLQIAQRPVRVHRGPGWVPVDTTLHRATGGLATTATTTPVRFAGGGADPLVVIDSPGGGRLTITWPTALPTPVIHGSTALYRNVLPDVDLQMTATDAGYTQHVIVKSRAAATRLGSIRLGVQASGLTLRAGQDGSIGAVDAHGVTQLSSPPAQMWDATHRHTAAVRTELHEGALTLVPDHALLRNPHTTYPVTIDPDFFAKGTGWAKVFSGKPTQSYWNGGVDGAEAKVGRCYENGYCNGIGAARSYFQFDLTWLHTQHAQIRGAHFRAREFYAPSCTPRLVDLYSTDPISSHTTWNSQPGHAQFHGAKNVALGHSASCGADWLDWSVTSGVTHRLSSNKITFELRADNENDQLGWKKFDSNPQLRVSYNRPPSAPRGLSTDSSGCTSTPDTTFVGTATPTLSAVLSDPDGSTVSARFEWHVKGDADPLGSAGNGWTGSGKRLAVGVPNGQLEDGMRITWRVRAGDGLVLGPWSSWCDFTVDLSAPNAAPGVDSSIYPPGTTPSGSVGQGGTFTFTAGGVPDVTRYYYGEENQPGHVISAAAPGGSATIVWTPTHYGPQWLYVQSADAAGHRSPVTKYEFWVREGTPPTVSWPLDGYGLTKHAVGAGGHDLTVTGLGTSAAWITGIHGDALHVDGTSGGYAESTGGRVIDTSKNFSVSAWTRIDKLGAYPCVVSMDGNRTPGFQLQATPEGTWAFVMAGEDVDGSGSGSTRLTSTTPVILGAWTHLVGVYDAGLHTMTLYVNGVAQGSADHTSTWSATGPITVGRSIANGTKSDFLTGAIDDIRIYDRVIAPTETSGSPDNVHYLATQPTVQQAFYPMDETTGTLASDAATGVHPATLHGDATWTEGIVGSGAVQLGGSGYLSVDKFRVHTDASYSIAAWVLRDTDTGTTQTVLSRGDANAGGFRLQHNDATNQWEFAVARGAGAATWTVASAPDDAGTGRWTHLVGVVDLAAGQVQLFVNSQLQGHETLTSSPIPAFGDLDIGRDWHGALDDVHIYLGALTGAQVDDLASNPVVTPSTPYTGGLSRFFSNDGNNITTATGIVPPGYHARISLGMPAPAGAKDTVELFSCVNGLLDTMTSTQADCEGGTPLGPIAKIYRHVDDAPNLQALYRCLTDASEPRHFDSTVKGCEGQVTEGVLGYTVALRGLIRYASNASTDRLSTIADVPADYHAQAPVGYLPGTERPGTVPLYGCLDGTDNFTSTDVTCGGGSATVQTWQGYIWTGPPDDGGTYVPLSACVSDSGDRFDSLDSGCEGGTLLRRLGWVVRP